MSSFSDVQLIARAKDYPVAWFYYKGEWRVWDSGEPGAWYTVKQVEEVTKLHQQGEPFILKRKWPPETSNGVEPLRRATTRSGFKPNSTSRGQSRTRRGEP